MGTVEVRQYQTANGRRPIVEWLESLRDGTARARILARVDRLSVGLPGDWKGVGEDVHELRIDHGPSYRVYCGHDGEALILLPCGGDKGRQAEDIQRARAYWKDYKARKRALPRGQPPAKRG